MYRTHSDDHENTPPRRVDARADEFAVHFQRAARVLWLIAVGVVHDTALAEDVVQEAAIIAFRKFDQFKPGTNFTAWMAQTVRYVALNESRREQRRTAVSLDQTEGDGFKNAGHPRSPLHESSLAIESNMRERADMNDLDESLKTALAEVNPIARACLLLRTVDGLEYSQISSLLSIPEGTAMSHVHRTRKFLRERLASPADHSFRDLASG